MLLRTFAICLTLMTYFASSVPGLMIFVHLATWRDTKLWHNSHAAVESAHGSSTYLSMVNHLSGAIEQPCDLLWTIVQEITGTPLEVLVCAQAWVTLVQHRA